MAGTQHTCGKGGALAAAGQLACAAAGIGGAEGAVGSLAGSVVLLLLAAEPFFAAEGAAGC